MARNRKDRSSTRRDARDVGTDSPASDEAKAQRQSGMQGAPRGHGETGGSDRQPAQASGRSGRGPEGRVRKGYDESERPSAQGDGDPSPHRVGASPGQQGHKQKSGTTGKGTVRRGEDEATVE